MHDLLAVAVVHCLRDLPKDGLLVLLGEVFKVSVEIVHERHLHEVSNETNVVIVEVEIVQMKDVGMLNLGKNARFSQGAIGLIAVHRASLKDLDGEAFPGLAMLDFLHRGRGTSAKFLQNFVIIFD